MMSDLVVRKQGSAKMSSSSWNQETKTKLNEKVTANYNDLGSLIRHVIRASKSNDVRLKTFLLNFFSIAFMIKFLSCLLLKIVIKVTFITVNT